jgi:hypothetical protein
MQRKRRGDKWWETAEWAYQYGAVSVRTLCGELGIDRPYFMQQARERGWEIIGKEPLVELRKLHRQAASKPGQEAVAAFYLERIEAMEDAHQCLIRMVRECEVEAA